MKCYLPVTSAAMQIIKAEQIKCTFNNLGKDGAERLFSKDTSLIE